MKRISLEMDVYVLHMRRVFHFQSTNFTLNCIELGRFK